MAVSDKDQMKQDVVGYHKRMAQGAWLDGEQESEKGSATMPKANSDHGIIGSAIQKKNA
jgi:hypothetical protein